MTKWNLTGRITGGTYDEERAMYNLQNTEVMGATFAGPADGESALKESRNVYVHHCDFSLRYPFWHAESFLLTDSRMDEGVRAPIWYAKNGEIARCTVTGVKCLRECEEISIKEATIRSAEFGWRCRGVDVRDTTLESEYLFFMSRDLDIARFTMKGKYSFQYVENATIEDSVLDTKDAFWHSKNVTVRNSTVKGEYLAWYSDGLTLINCKIIGTQPLCYCTNLRLINCTMVDTDLAFEYSDVEADICGEILSVKNPRSGRILADAIGEVILEQSIMSSDCEIAVRS